MRTRVTFVCFVVLLWAVTVWADPLTLTGTVLGPDGKPVAGAQVLTLQLLKPSEVSIVDTTTDAAGAFVLKTEIAGWSQQPRPPAPNDGLPMMARKAGFALAVGNGLPGTPVTLTLGDKPEKRAGVILDFTGKPLAGVPVVIAYLMPSTPQTVQGPGPVRRQQFFSFSRNDTIKALTDDQGRFAFDDIPPGLAIIVTVTLDGYANMQVRLADDKPVTLTAKPEAMLSGKVTHKGEPVADVRVAGRVQDEQLGGASATTAADGTYTLRHLSAGQATVYAMPTDDYSRPAAQTVTLTAGQTATGIDFVLTVGGVVKGRVTDQGTGKPVPEASVVAMSGDGRFNSAARTATDGTYSLRLTPGTYTLSYQDSRGMVAPPPPADGKTVAPPNTVTVKEGEVIEGKDFAIKPPRKVQGQVLLPDGQPATAARVTASMQYMWNQRVEMKDGGRFEVTVPEPPPVGQGVPNMPNLLIAQDTEKNLFAILRADKLPDQITMTLQPAASATMQVLDPQSQPLPGIRVMALACTEGAPGAFNIGEAETDKAGLARFTALPTGMKLSFNVDWNMARLQVTEAFQNQNTYFLQPGEERKLPPVVLDLKGRSLNVFVGDADGKPIPAAQVYAENVQKPFATDEKGKVTLTGLAMRGKVALFAAHPTQPWYAADSVDPDAGVWPGLLVKPLGTVTGQLVFKEGGKPIAGAEVTFYFTRGGMYWIGPEYGQKLGIQPSSEQHWTTDADGHFKIDKFLAGVEYQLSFRFKTPDGQRPLGRGFVFKAEGGATPQDLGVIECVVPKAGPGGPPAGGPGGPPPPPPPPPMQ